MTLPVLTDTFLDILIAQVRSYVPSLAGRVGGAAEFKMLPEAANMAVPAAYVIPLDDEAEKMSQNGVRHKINDGFAVIVALSNAPDERGQASASAVYGMRRELWRALVGFQPSTDYRGIAYEGRTLLALDRSRAWWQFEFSVYHEISETDGWQDIWQDSLPVLQTIHLHEDDIDPAADANVKYPGPDGRIEFQAEITLAPPN